MYCTCEVGTNVSKVLIQNLSAISSGSVIVLPLDSNDDGKGALLRLFVTSLNNFQVVLRPFLVLSN